MARNVFGTSVQGASHVRSGRECQDSLRFVGMDEDTVILAVADGHGSDACPYSREGAEAAVDIFCRIMAEYLDTYREQPEMLFTFLKRESDTKIAQTVEAEWKRRILRVHAGHKRETPAGEDGGRDRDAVYRMYGSTLVGLVITSGFLFAFQLGDGDIMEVSAAGVHNVIEADKILGTETHSLSRPDAWRKAVTAAVKIGGKRSGPVLYMLSTDGMANSYRDEDEFHKTCRDYYKLIKKHGAQAVEESLAQWLSETSSLGCGDDITALFAYFS